ncbi:ATP-binding protein [Streptomyces yokosukanensis]|uniref:ATP-binding protein n=1 Tax=Streptomyces yokosukanensis TaxID=67386 RepID=A0A101P3C0_9ACTN|nr:ATP-binding protein [Streptomyces yokosukanensis]
MTDVPKEDFLVLPTDASLSAEATDEQSLHVVLNKLLTSAGLDQVEVLRNVDLPLTSMRAAVVLAGHHPDTGRPSYFVLELKDWASVSPYDGASTLCSVDGDPAPVLNPAEEVKGTCDYLAAFNGAIIDETGHVAGAAFLHNTTAPKASGVQAVPQGEQTMLFTSDGQDQLIDALRSRLAPAPGADAAAALLNSEPRPATQLMGVAADEVRSAEQFILLKQQRLAYELVLNAVRKAEGIGPKEIVIVTGGPGSGKSVIALSLLGELDRNGYKAAHATGSQSFTKTMRKIAGAGDTRVKGLFKYFNSFMQSKPEEFDVLICDEAHRLRETSVDRYTPAAQRTGRPQIDELLDVARVPVFLLDEHQVVRPGETGTVEFIKSAAAARGYTCHVVPLADQFRCGGSEEYLRWVVRLLELAPGGPIEWVPDGKVTLQVAETPEELESVLRARRSEGYNARISAGYCWPWTKKIPAGQDLPEDVVIGEWRRPWNVAGDKRVAGAPPSALWATDPAGFGQVGCVYTAQGFEYDWSGVILGPDLVWREDRWVADRSASKDTAFKKSTPDDELDRLIRNTYKVLLTRGMIGTVIFSTDAETRAKLKELVSQQ